MFNNNIKNAYKFVISICVWSLTKSSDGWSGHKSEKRQWDMDSVDLGCHVHLTLRVKTTEIRRKWFKRSDCLHLQNDLEWYAQPWNNFCFRNGWSNWGRGLWGWRETGLKINTRLWMFLSSHLSGNSKVTHQRSKSDTWFQLTAPCDHEATRGRAERRRGNVKLMSG